MTPRDRDDRPPVRSHDELESLIAAHVLDGLDDPQRDDLARRMAEHGPDCQECARLMREYGAVAAEIGSAVEPMALSPQAEATLMERVRRSPRRAEQSDGIRRIHRAPRWAVAVAAAVALVGVVVGSSLVSRNGTSDRFVAFASARGTRLVPFPSSNGQGLAVIFHEGASGGWIIGSNLSGPPAGRVYELWFRPGPDAPMQPAGTFVPDGGAVLAPVDLGPAFDLVAVSVEPEGGSPQPTTDPVFVASI